ncbi:MAG: glycosyltransferase [Bacteroidetes bacterium]|nr:MAG: glycosyltransferase [Bacteroidota bacterium]
MKVLLFWGLLGATVVQLLFWGGVVGRLLFRRQRRFSPEEKKLPPCTVLLCARDEADNLRKNLPRILNQNYHCFEVLVIIHNSRDDSEKVLADLQRTYPQLRYERLDTPPSQVGKKIPLSKGIARARHPVLLLTDADCRPASRHWMRRMMEPFAEGAEVVLGVSPFEERPGLLNRFIRFEGFYTAIQYLGFARLGLPYMGVGRNLAYRKNLFERVGGFAGHENLPSGDDDLLVSAFFRARARFALVTDPESYTFSPTKTTLLDYYRQKTRHLSTSTRYLPGHQVLLGAVSASHFLHYALLLPAALFIGGPFAAMCYAVRLSLVWSLCISVLNNMSFKNIGSWVPLLDALMIAYYVILAPSITFRNTKKWK